MNAVVVFHQHPHDLAGDPRRHEGHVIAHVGIVGGNGAQRRSSQGTPTHSRATGAGHRRPQTGVGPTAGDTNAARGGAGCLAAGDSGFDSSVVSRVAVDIAIYRMCINVNNG